ncbi:hypothetical protein ABZ816_21675 [Actinosynnema sp. NPDC047251]|uniref:Uncharacterized protein n=1 Tax=Saccharothrix espanaensis (strain ATCC 51144 / DSM 44229 / JCM 9112 / NBRC 15066 / NRRL 15764) TaxID=1179773 RepID=K0K656_SACES|nr:hypothetical protein [Saccharothrix espanaensis]CCH33786.1 hypothetical protein BN6_65480 [Saccharothrix espanaensis DSM 44229]
MSVPGWEGDEVLLRDLTEALAEARAVPEQFYEAARAAFTWRTVDAELMLLTSYDSILDAELAGRARAALTARQLVFDAEGISVQVEVTEAGVAGQVLPARAARVTLLTATGPVEDAELDELGCFLLGPPPAGPIRFRLQTGSTTVMTDWVCV